MKNCEFTYKFKLKILCELNELIFLLDYIILYCTYKIVKNCNAKL